MELKNIVPWGRNKNEYQDMFNLTEQMLSQKILGCADGPASFNAEWTALGGQVISVDPIYDYSAAQIKQRIDEITPTVINEVKAHQQNFIWTRYLTPDELLTTRLEAMDKFLQDYPQGVAEQRYRKAMLPHLEFEDNEFDLALCSHLLFLYSEQLDLSFHTEAILELCRVAKEVRIYPLIQLNNQASPHLSEVIKQLQEKGFIVSQKQVSYEFQHGADQMLLINKT